MPNFDHKQHEKNKKLGKIEVASIYLSIALGLLGCSMSRFLQQGCALLYQSIKLMGYSLICKLWSNQSNLQLGSNMMSLDLIELDGRFFRQTKKKLKPNNSVIKSNSNTNCNEVKYNIKYWRVSKCALVLKSWIEL